MKKVGFILEVQGSTESINKLAALELELDQLNKKIREAKKLGQDDVYAALRNQQEGLKTRISDTRKEIRGQIKDFEKAKFPADSIIGLERAYSKLRQQIRQTSKTDTRFKEMSEEAKKLKDEINELSSGFGDTKTNIGNYEESVINALQSTGLLGQQTLSTLVSLVKGSGPFGVAGALLTGIALTGKYISDTTKEVIALRGEIQKFTGVTGSQLDDLSTRVDAFNVVFQLTTNQTGQAVAATIDQLGVSSARATELIEKGLLGAADSADFIGRVSTELKQITGLGVSDDSAFALLVDASNKGINVDVLAEPIIKLRERLPSTVKALEDAFGKEGTQKLFKEFEERPIDAIQRISDKINELPDNSVEVGQLLADVFSASGEDALQTAKNIGELETSLDNVVQSTNSLTQAQQLQLASQRLIAESENELAKESEDLVVALDELAVSVSTRLQTGFNKIITGSIRAGKQLSNLFTIASGGVVVGEDLSQLDYTDVLKGLSDFSKDILKTKQPVKELSLTFSQLTEKQKALKDEITQLRLDGNFPAAGRKMKEYREVTKRLTNATKVFTKSAKKQKKQIELLPIGTLGRLRQEVKALEKELEVAPESKIPEIVEKIVAKSGEITKATNEINRLKSELNGLSTSGGTIELTTLQSEVTQTEQGESGTEAERLEERKQRAVAAKLEEIQAVKDVEEQQRLLEIDTELLKIEFDKQILAEKLAAQEINNEEYLSGINDLAEKEIDIQSKKNKKLQQAEDKRTKFLLGTFETIGEGFGDFIDQQDKSIKGFLKSSAAALLKVIEREIDLLIAKIIAKEVASKSFFGLATGLALGAAVKGTFAVAKSKLQNLDTGGVIKPMDIGNGLINARPNIPTQRGGDNVLVTARTGEVVLNKQQQATLQQAAGSDIFKKMGVPGFVTGGAIGNAVPQIVNPNTAIVFDTNAIKEAMMEGISEMIPELTESVRAGAEVGAMSGSEQGTMVGVENASTNAERQNDFNVKSNSV